MEGASAYAAPRASDAQLADVPLVEGLFEHAAPYVGYVYPNETDIPWTVLIVVYPYLTGLVAGAFTVSSLYHVFGMQRFEPVAKLALLTALCFLIVVPAALLLHLGHPERAFNSMITPHWTSAFVMFGFMAGFYVILLMLENWFVFRPHIVQQAQQKDGMTGLFYRVLSLGSYDVSAKALRYDEKIIFALAVIGIPAAHGLHGYVGFVFGSLKSREWWSSDLMPPIFLFSAIISGTALLIVLYVVTSRLRRIAIDLDCMKGLGYTLWGFMMFTLVLEGVEFGALVYRGREGIDVIMEYVSGRLVIPFFVLQFGLGSLVPIVILSYMIWRGTTGKALIAGVTASAVLVLLAVLMMRWNVVIGGQEIAKTGKGLLTYQPPFFGREGLLAASLVLLAPLAFLWWATRLFPPWGANGAASAPSHAGAR
jgi:Ni/Fe-hydrogenase subunit HybB-like protein